MSALLNIETFKDIVDGDGETFIPILEDLEVNGAKLLEKISLASQARELNKVKQAAHQLKGSTGMLGLERTYDLCTSVETLEGADINDAFLKDLHDAFYEGLSLAKENL